MEGKPSLLGVEHNTRTAHSSRHHRQHSPNRHQEKHRSVQHDVARDLGVGVVRDDNNIMTNSDYDDYYDEDADRYK